jgi:hypothetical protein
LTEPGLDNTGDTQREAYYDHLISHVEQVSGVVLSQDVEAKRIFSQRDYINDPNAFKGTAPGLSHTLFQTAVFRPAHHGRKAVNLSHTGQYTHPGVGVPMTLIASEIIADELRDSGLLKAGTGMSSKQRTQIFKSGSRIYYTSSIFFPPAKRREVAVLYAFVRIADDYVNALPRDAKGFSSLPGSHRDGLGHVWLECTGYRRRFVYRV